MKVYCRSCKHHKSIERYAMHSVCKLTKFTVDHPTHTRVDWEECNVINANNDCSNYECKWLTALVERFVAEKEDVIKSRSEILDIR